MKKLLAILLVLAMVMGLAACGSEPADDDKKDKDNDKVVQTTEEPTEEETTEPITEPEAGKASSSAELVHGVTDGKFYNNDSINVEIELPSSWEFMSDEELSAMMSLAGEVDTALMMEAFERFGMFYELMAYDSEADDVIQIVIQDLNYYGGDAAGDDEYLDAMVLAARYQSTVSDVSEYEEVVLGSETYTKATLDVVTPAGHSVKQAYYVSVQGDYVVSISITVKDTEISEIESYFR